MVETEFAPWLARKSWNEAGRFCRVVAILLPFVIVFVDVPLLLDPARRGNPVALGLVGWHLLAESFCLGILYAGRPSSRVEPARGLAVATIGILLLSALVGVLTWLRQGDVSLYALGTVFVATMLCTPRHYRRPLYAASVFLLAIPMVVNYESVGKLFNDLLHPACVGFVALQLDKYVYTQNLRLFKEMRRAEHERARADKVLFNVFPTSIANELKRDEKVNAVKFDQMGVMFADIVGFTSFSRALPPQALVIVLDEIFSRIDRLVERYGLEKIKTIGDAYMAVSHKDTEKLVLLALDTLESIRLYNVQNGTELQLRIGIHVGPAVAGVIGVKRFLYDVWGDTVNVASRMESGGEAGRVHVTEAVFQQLRGQFDFECRGEAPVKGKGPMTTYFVKRRQASASAAGSTRPEAIETV
jgi:adenylate cyclase